MKNLFVILLGICLMAACNSKHDGNGSENYKVNPAEMIQQSGSNSSDTARTANSSEKSDRSSDRGATAGASDNAEGAPNSTGKTISTDGEAIDVPANNEDNK